MKGLPVLKLSVISERVESMARRNNLKFAIGTDHLVIMSDDPAMAEYKITVSPTSRMCRVSLFQGGAQYPDVPFVELERRCRILGGINV